MMCIQRGPTLEHFARTIVCINRLDFSDFPAVLKHHLAGEKQKCSCAKIYLFKVKN